MKGEKGIIALLCCTVLVATMANCETIQRGRSLGKCKHTDDTELLHMGEEVDSDSE